MNKLSTEQLEQAKKAINTLRIIGYSIIIIGWLILFLRDSIKLMAANTVIAFNKLMETHPVLTTIVGMVVGFVVLGLITYYYARKLQRPRTPP